MSGKLIVIEGLDGSGKHTQTSLLYEYLSKKISNIRKIEFPTYTKSSALLEMYLGGEFGDNPNDVNVYASSTFFAVDRFSSFTLDWGNFYKNGGIVITDRYTTANVPHQMSKLPKHEWDEFADWLFTLEFDRFGLPRPDCVFFLDVPPSYSKALLEKRYEGDETKKDVHEKDFAYLEKCYTAAIYAVEHLGWQRIECYNSEKGLLTVEEIHEKLKEKIDELSL